MYVSYLLDKDSSMYHHQNAVARHPSLNLNPQNFVPTPPQYSDFAGYHHHVPGMNNDPHPGQNAGWNPAYPPPRDEWSSHYGHPGTASGPPSTSNAAAVGPPLGFSPPEFSGQPSALLPASLNPSVGQLSPNSPQRRNPYDWMRRSSAPPSNTSKMLLFKLSFRLSFTSLAFS